MSVAVINGTALTPGVSLNSRLYTPKAIARMVARAQERIADPHGKPIVMRTHHQAGDNSRLIVGKVTSVNLEEDGSATYKAKLYGTQPGKDIAALVTDEDPALRTVSISGGWLGAVRTTEYQGQTVETADDLEIDAIDFTASPGVVGALISSAKQTTSESASRNYTPISESYQATVRILEEAPLPLLEADKTPYGDVAYADPGKQSDGVKRYPLDTKANAKAAWSYINMPKNAKKYSSSDLATIKGRIKAALKKFGVQVSDEESGTRYSEIREYYPNGSNGEAGLCIDAYSGQLSVTFRACGLDSSSLKAVGAAAMNAATSALAALDADTDGDIDVPGAPMEDSDNDMESVVKIDIEGSVLGESDLRKWIQEEWARLQARHTAEEAAPPPGDEDGPGTAPDDPSHSHTHSGDATHTHGHVHQHETAGDPYSHTHGHTHTHLPGGPEEHQHMHNHDHASAPEDTHENHEKESAVSETEKNAAAEAAPTRMFTPEDLADLGKAIALGVAEAMKAAAPAAPETAPEAPAAQESAPVAPAAAPVAEAAPAVDVEALKKEIRDGLRAEILKENGVPSRTGYRLSESDVQNSKQEADTAWENRATLLLGSYGLTPVPLPGTGIAAQ